MCQVIEKFVKKEILYDGGSTNTAGALKVRRPRRILILTSLFIYLIIPSDAILCLFCSEQSVLNPSLGGEADAASYIKL